MSKPCNHPRRNRPPPRDNHGGYPVRQTGNGQLIDPVLERYGSGRIVTAAEAEFAQDGDKTYRRRAEVLVDNGQGILCIRRKGYLLLPGGGVDEGEETEQAVIREALEEAAARLKNLKRVAHYRAEPPAGHPIAKGARGVDTQVFLAEHAGDWEGQHPDQEDFAFLPYRDCLAHLEKARKDPRNGWDETGHQIRVHEIERLMERPTKSVEEAPQLCYLEDDQQPNGIKKAFIFDLDETLRTWADPETSHVDPDGVQIMPHRREVLQALKGRGYRLFAATNHTIYSDQTGAREALTPQALRDCQVRTADDLHGLLEDIVWMSRYDETLAKPNPAMLDDLVRRYDLDPKECLYCGDQDTDRDAARAAGMDFLYARDVFGESVGANTPTTKQADAPVTIPRNEFLMMTPDGQLVVKPTGRRRYEFPHEGQGTRIPYTTPTRFLPPEGVPEPGVHGYQYNFMTGPAGPIPQGYEARDPQAVLKDLYGAMGLAENRDYQPIDRARAQAILRVIRAQKKRNPEGHTVTPPVTTPQVTPEVTPEVTPQVPAPL